VIGSHQQDPGLVVEDGDVQPVGPDGQPGYHGVDPVAEQRVAWLVPRQVQGLHVGIRMLVA
jgi:hypothetical protein